MIQVGTAPLFMSKASTRILFFTYSQHLLRELAHGRSPMSCFFSQYLSWNHLPIQALYVLHVEMPDTKTSNATQKYLRKPKSSLSDEKKGFTHYTDRDGTGGDGLGCP